MRKKTSMTPTALPSPSVSGSEAGYNHPLPVRCIKLTLQLADTENNRRAMIHAQEFISKLSPIFEGYLPVVKREEITIIECGRPTPHPNAESSDLRDQPKP